MTARAATISFSLGFQDGRGWSRGPFIHWLCVIVMAWAGRFWAWVRAAGAPPIRVTIARALDKR